MRQFPKGRFVQYRDFVNLFEAGSFYHAEKLSGMAHNNIKKNVVDLGKELGIPLVYTVGRRTMLTDEAKELYARITPLFDNLSLMEEEIGEFNEDSVGLIRVSVSPYFGGQIVSKYISEFRKKYKNINFKLYTKFHDEALEMLEKREIDLMLFIWHADEGEDTVILQELNNAFFASHEFAEQNNLNGTISKEQLKELTVVAPKKFVLVEQLERAGLIKKMMEVESTQTAVHLVGENQGLSFCIEEYFHLLGNSFVKLESEDIPLPKCYFGCKKGLISSKAVLRFIDFLKAEHHLDF